MNSNIKQNISFTPIKNHTSIHSSKQIRKNPIDTSSPCLGRRFSSTSSSSLFFDTPNSSFSRTTTASQIMIKTDRETQISFPSNLDMINQLISQMNFNLNNNENKIDYNPTELSKKLFHQCMPFSSNNNKYQPMNLLFKKQYLNFGRYEIEILFPTDHNKVNNNTKKIFIYLFNLFFLFKNSAIYACDICLKHFHGSLIAFQRHTAKCLYTQPPGKLVFNKDDLAIFEIGETNMNMEQRIYMKLLCRIVRLFIDSNKTIDDTKIDRFSYYILCRKDPILSQFQVNKICLNHKRLIYFSKELSFKIKIR